MKPFFSIIMPTYNSETTLHMSLGSIRDQDIDQSLLEILVLDGGSTDATREIAESYGATVINNPKRLPEPAIHLGLNHAVGKYCIKMGSDEVFISADQLSKRMYFFETHEDVHTLVANRLMTPSDGTKAMGVSASYLNLYGDPFSMFVYRGRGSVRQNFENNILETDKDVMVFSERDSMPIGDGGSTTISKDYIIANMPERLSDQSFASSCFSEITRKTGRCGCIDGDDLLHYSASTLPSYLKKLKFRVINNLFHKEESGFSAREANNASANRRKYLFVLYAASIIGPAADAIRLSARHNDPTMLLHFVYTYYVCAQIALNLFKGKVLKQDLTNTAYGA